MQPKRQWIAYSRLLWLALTLLMLIRFTIILDVVGELLCDLLEAVLGSFEVIRLSFMDLCRVFKNDGHNHVHRTDGNS